MQRCNVSILHFRFFFCPFLFLFRGTSSLTLSQTPRHTTPSLIRARHGGLVDYYLLIPANITLRHFPSHPRRLHCTVICVRCDCVLHSACAPLGHVIRPTYGTAICLPLQAITSKLPSPNNPE
ncbi:hypothetical protein B0J11DRAFT_262286 [Dendryphion nanum]|uniref:Secreted protein n=1 Tax=Dendryphion nanum TaxID=256645 RepID=A0A9P9E4B3_9PLEO|nr:hypothetical protein B0J11DRAFT_262286 [Dendryphion nanum]